MAWPDNDETFQFEFDRFSRALAKASSGMVGQYVARRWIEYQYAELTPTEMIAKLREMADELEATGIR